MNEDSRGLGRHYKGMNSIPKSQDFLHGSKHSKDEETSVYAQGNTTRAWPRRLEHAKLHTHAPRARAKRPEHT